MMPDPRLATICSQLNRLMTRDPVGRGTQHLIDASRQDGARTLYAAANNLVPSTGTVGIVTGFYIANAPVPAAETDGPPGALFLGRLLTELEIEVVYLTDAFGAPLLAAGLDALGLPTDSLVQVPFEETSQHRESGSAACPVTDAWAQYFLQGDLGKRLTSLVAIERAGPSHTIESCGQSNSVGACDFERQVPPTEQNACHNMAGNSIEYFTAKTHRLFDLAQERGVKTIGIGDGGNEIGFGRVPWAALSRAIAGANGARSACRIATDHLLIAGISDWGAYALAIACCCAANRPDLLHTSSVLQQRRLIEHLVRETDAVDGISLLRAATVDSLSLDAYLDPLAAAIEIALA